MITIPHSSVQTDVATSKNELRYKESFFPVLFHTFEYAHITTHLLN